MKKLSIGLSCALVAMALAFPAMAKGPAGETVTVSWLEDAVRYYPDGTTWASWTDDPNGPAELAKTGEAYHFVNIGEFYNVPLPDISGSAVISGSGRLSGHCTYTSVASGLPIKERLKGRLSVDPEAGTMVGTYTQWASAFGSRDDVLENYPEAVPDRKQGSGWWLIGYTEYTAH